MKKLMVLFLLAVVAFGSFAQSIEQIREDTTGDALRFYEAYYGVKQALGNDQDQHKNDGDQLGEAIAKYNEAIKANGNGDLSVERARLDEWVAKHNEWNTRLNANLEKYNAFVADSNSVNTVYNDARKANEAEKTPIFEESAAYKALSEAGKNLTAFHLASIPRLESLLADITGITAPGSTAAENLRQAEENLVKAIKANADNKAAVAAAKTAVKEAKAKAKAEAKAKK
jgi:hypothetical protein